MEQKYKPRIAPSYRRYPCSDSSRRRKPPYRLRCFTNWAKVKMIRQAVPDDLEKSVSVMDLGCNKGVDLKKWANAKVSNLYMVDYNNEDLEECRRRFQEISSRWPNRLKASFINKHLAYDCVKLPEEVDLVSSGYHLSFDTREEAVTLTRNVARALKTGGHFIVSMLNADIIKSLIYQTDDRMHYNNEFYAVDLDIPLTDACPEFGIKMLFRVHENVHKTNLVQMKTIETAMKEGNLELVWRRSFPELYKEALQDKKQMQLLVRMGVVENGELLMSVSEREIAALYEAVMFRKIENKIKMETFTTMEATAAETSHKNESEELEAAPVKSEVAPVKSEVALFTFEEQANSLSE